MNDRAVISAAVMDADGEIHVGRYHGEAIDRALLLKAPKVPDYIDPSWDVGYYVGFVTGEFEFLSRDQAFERGKEIGQLAADTELWDDDGIHTAEFKKQDQNFSQ